MELTRSQGNLDVDGNSIHYLKEGIGPPMLLLQGSGISSTSWRHNIDHLSRYFSLYVLDLPYSEEIPPFHHSHDTLNNCVETVYRITSVLRIDRAHLVGNSFGGIVAARFSLRYPEKVHRLVLINAVGLGETRYSGEEHSELQGLEESESGRLLLRPALIITGELNSLICREPVYSIAAKNPFVKCVIIPGASALPHEENPEAVNERIISFCVGMSVDVLCG